jgi:hypothetical protein
MYESNGDLERERKIIDEFCTHGAELRAHKLPCPPYKIDWLLFKAANAFAWVEVKNRSTKIAPYLLGLHKFIALAEIATASKLPSLLVVRWCDSGEIGYTKIRESEHDGIQWMQDNRNRDETDGEPCVALAMERFHFFKTLTKS